MLRAYFIRHGETDWNVVGRLQGLTDTELNARGVAQAELLAERLAQEPDFDALYTSPLRRAYVTSEIIARRVGLLPVPDARLVERNMGELEGLNDAEIKERYPEHHKALRDGGKRTPVRGEEAREWFHKRIVEFLQDLQSRHPQGRAMVVTHGGAMGMIMATVMRLDLELRFPFWFDNASLNIVEFGGPIPRVLALNDICHLRGGFSHPQRRDESLLDEKANGGEPRPAPQSAAL